MLARAVLGSFLLCASGCFSEPSTNTGEQCVDGKPGCDCGVDDACDAGLECVISIDKCVPLDCTSGAFTCTCTDGGGCSGTLVCEGGVCLEPPTGTTGHESGVAEVSTVGSAASSATSGGSSETLGTLSTTDLPTTSLTTDTLEGSITDVTDATLSTDTSASEGGPFDCNACLEAAASGGCSTQFGMCNDAEVMDGCADLSQCVFDGNGSIAECCAEHGNATGHVHWNAFALCADAMECMGMCTSACPV
jgi:hypothetical protein